MNKWLLTLAGICLHLFLFAQTPPKREHRGAWIATVFNVDWPTSGVHTPARQRDSLIRILDLHQAAGFNAVYFQVRTQSDALYNSALDPWSPSLTGFPVRNPGWDPLQFVIDECRKRNMELHAWLNPYRAATSATALNNFPATHIGRARPQLLLQTTGTPLAVPTLNPGLEAVRAYVDSVVNDIINKYDVDGIHFDDYFYPNSAILNDNAAYEADPRGFAATPAGRADWRRDNVNLLIKRVHDSIVKKKPWVKFGVSPTGIYRNSTNPAVGSATAGLEHYTTLYADSKRWLQEGWIDYLAPQVYWWIGQPGSNYGVLAPWWNNNAFGRLMYIGMAGYKVGDPAQGQFNTNNQQIPAQIRLNRSLSNISGQIIYHTTSLRQNRLGFRDSLQQRFFYKPALQPLMPWIDAAAPDAPQGVEVLRWSADSVTITWNSAPSSANELDKVRQWVVYRSTDAVVDITNAENILAITNQNFYADTSVVAGTNYYYTVTALDRLHNESAPSATESTLTPVITCSGDQSIDLGADCNVSVPDYTTAISNPKGWTLTQSPAAGSTINGTTAVTVTITATDKAGNTGNCTFVLTPKDVTPPQLSVANSVINLGTDDGICAANYALPAPAATDGCGTVTVTGIRSDNAALNAPFAKGETTVTWTANDQSGNSTTAMQKIVVSDDEAPIITGARTSVTTLWPPNGKMHTVDVLYDATDNCGTVIVDLSISSNEPQNGSAPDYAVLNNHQVELRAKRNGNGDGRIYSITITAKDEAGNVSTKQLQVTVPHDKGKGKKDALEVRLTPNPSISQFMLYYNSKDKAPVQVVVTDGYGRVLEAHRNLPANGYLSLCNACNPGTYRIEVRQGSEVQVLQAVKQ